jgi:hypothetical protein
MFILGILNQIQKEKKIKLNFESSKIKIILEMNKVLIYLAPN